MRLLGRNLLQALYSRNKKTDKWLTSWTAEVRSANWKHADDVRRQFPSASFSEPILFVFPVGESGNQIKLAVMFPLGIAVITDLDQIPLTDSDET